MKTLLHTCCAPCANQCIEVLQTDGFDVTAYWYNPNIHPFTEYRSRRNCLREYCTSIDLQESSFIILPSIFAVISASWIILSPF